VAYRLKGQTRKPVTMNIAPILPDENTRMNEE
jgi:hypothetical protein